MPARTNLTRHDRLANRLIVKSPSVLDLRRRIGRRESGIAAPGAYDRVVLHIGRQKTGTSVLQHTFSDNLAALAAVGVTYPRVGRDGVAHHALAKTLLTGESATTRDREESERLADALATAMESARGTWLFSSEALQNVADPAALTRFFDPRRTDVVVYLREQYAFAQSAYAQRVHATRETEIFEDYLKRMTIGHAALLARWRERFEPRRLIVRGYARSALVNGDIVDDFFAAAELPPIVFARGVVVQKPLPGGSLLEFKRIVNGLPDLPEEFDRRAFRTFPALAESTASFRIKPSIEPAGVAAYRANFAEENTALIAAHPLLREALAPGSAETAPPRRRTAFRRVWTAIAEHDPRLFKLLVKAVGVERSGEPRDLTVLRNRLP